MWRPRSGRTRSCSLNQTGLIFLALFFLTPVSDLERVSSAPGLARVGPRFFPWNAPPGIRRVPFFHRVPIYEWFKSSYVFFENKEIAARTDLIWRDSVSLRRPELQTGPARDQASLRQSGTRHLQVTCISHLAVPAFRPPVS
jgi:hypothetical protein